MPIENYWANNEQSILIEKFYDVWTWDQVIDTCQNHINPTLSPINHPVVLIQDMIGSHWTPTINLLSEVQRMMMTPYHDNVSMILVVSGDAAIDTLVVAAYKRYGKADCTYQACSTINKAIIIANDYLS